MTKRKSKSDAAEEFKEAGEDLLKEVSLPDPLVIKEAPKPASKPKAEIKSAAQRISFDRWFSTTGRPSHHKAGMRSYTKASGRKTKPAWDQLFAKY